MIAAIGTRVVFLNINIGITDSTNRAPIQSAEMHNQIRGNITNGVVDLLWFKNKGVKRLTLIVLHSLDLVLEHLILRGRDRALGFASLHVKKNSGVIAAFAPHLGFCPVDLELIE